MTGKAGAGRYDQVKNRVHTLLDEPDRGDPGALVVQGVIAGAIVINTLAVILFTMRSMSEQYRFLLDPIIVICLLIFTAEYCLRIWSCTSARDPKVRVRDRLRYAFHLYQIIDLISIIPILFPIISPDHLDLLRTFCIISIFKLGRYSRYFHSLEQLKRVLLRKREIFAIMLFFLVFVVLFSSAIMFLVENPAQPDKFTSIPAAMWWAMMTVTTVGYGDIIPVTPLGKVIGSVMTFAGVLVLALPSAILATGFIEEREKRPGSDPDGSRIKAQKDLFLIFTRLYEEEKISAEEFEESTRNLIRLYKE